jgi:hypothetical protein
MLEDGSYAGADVAGVLIPLCRRWWPVITRKRCPWLSLVFRVTAQGVGDLNNRLLAALSGVPFGVAV